MKKRSKFDLSSERKMSLNMAELIPIMHEEVLPGDKFRSSTELFLRFAPMLAPVMHRMNAFVHFFFVPDRIIWSEFEDFITGGRDGTLAPVHPFLEFPIATAPDRSVNGALADYLGLPTYPTGTTMTNNMAISALPFRAYQLIYNEYYRDQNLTDPVPFSLGSGAVSGPDLLAITLKRTRAWEKDYFTSALPWAQRGGVASAPVGVDYLPQSNVIKDSGGPSGATALNSGASGGLVDTAGTQGLRIENIENASVTINELRKANRVQEWLERNARGGARYIEQILSQFGVLSSDARLQRPEYLGGGRAPVVISEVLSNFQFSGDPDGLPQGNMAGHGISVGSGNGFSRSFEEHGRIIGILTVMPRTSYQQGIHRKWTRFDKFDYAWPAFANLGEQEVKSTEIYQDPTLPVNTPATTFGYQERYAEYKYGQSTVHGDMRDSLAYWHEGRIFAAEPVLNESFVTCDPSHRIFAVTDPAVHKLYCQVYNRVSALRPLPFFGIPRLG